MDQSENKHLITGKLGEDFAAKHLVSKGFKIVCRNYWKPWGEIDIVAKRDGLLHFVEVKTVSRERWEEGNWDDWEPEDNVHFRKKQRLARVIETYLQENNLLEAGGYQIDIISVYLSKRGEILKTDIIEDVNL